jgi:hypothetical protein
MTPHTVTAHQWWDHATLWNADDPNLLDAGHTTDGGRVFGITRTRYAECDHYGCKPVIVIDLTSHEQIEGLRDALDDEIPTYVGRSAVDRALLRFATPTPPKPDEPMGLGAVVEDAEGYRYVRSYDDEGIERPWHVIDRAANKPLGWWRWDDIAVVRVLSEGVS